MRESTRRERAHFEEALEAGDYEAALSRIGSEKRPDALLEIADRVDDEELRALLAEFWNAVDSPGDRVEELLGLFRRVGYVADTPERLNGELTIYRGTFGDGPDSRLSWTLDEEKARWFARRLGEAGTPSVWRAKVDSADVLGYFVIREEAEVVVDPGSVRDLTRLEV
jgi:hypothetical protein